MPNQRLHFSKKGTARFISHLDLMRTFQRAFQRAGLSVRHTEGFNPHAFVSILLPLSVGYSSQCELLEFGLLGDTPKEEVPARMNRVLPAGITVHSCYDGGRPAKELALVNYIVTMDYPDGIPPGTEAALRGLLDQERLVIAKKSRKAKSGETKVDLIPLIKRCTVAAGQNTVTLDALLKAQNPGLNPALILSALELHLPAFSPALSTFHRKAFLDEAQAVFR